MNFHAKHLPSYSLAEPTGALSLVGYEVASTIFRHQQQPLPRQLLLFVCVLAPLTLLLEQQQQ